MTESLTGVGGDGYFYYFGYDNLRTYARAETAGQSGDLTVDQGSASGSFADEPIYYRMSVVGAHRFTLLYSAWDATLSCTWSMNGTPVVLDEIDSARSELVLASEFQTIAGAGADVGVPGLGAGVAVNSQIESTADGYLLAFLWDGGGPVRGRLRARGPEGQSYSNQDPPSEFVFVHEATHGPWSFSTDYSAGNAARVWIFDLPWS